MTIQLTLFTCKKTLLYKSRYMAHVAAFCAKTSFYIFWWPDLWRYTETPHMYKVTFLIESVYKKKMSPHTQFFCVS